MPAVATHESLCNELLQAAGRLFHHHTSIDGDPSLGVTSEAAASAASTVLSSSIPGTDQPVSSRLHRQRSATAVWSTYQAAAAAGTELTEAAWQAVWDWQTTPGDTTQHAACCEPCTAATCWTCSNSTPLKSCTAMDCRQTCNFISGKFSMSFISMQLEIA